MATSKRVVHFVFYGLLFAATFTLFAHITNGITTPFRKGIEGAMGLH